MAGSKRPYFPFYVHDFAADPVVSAMTAEQVGAYILLLCMAWQQEPQGSIPDDDATLARWCRMPPKRWKSIKPGVTAAFRKHGSRYVQKRLTEEARKLADRAIVNAENGCRGGRPKKTESVISGLGLGSFSETETKAYAGARAGSGYGFGSGSGNSETEKQSGDGGGVSEAGAELAQVWAFHCTRKRRDGMPADTAAEKAPEFTEAVRLGANVAELKGEIERPGRNKNEHLWQFWKRMTPDRPVADNLDGIRDFVASGEPK